MSEHSRSFSLMVVLILSAALVLTGSTFSMETRALSSGAEQAIVGGNDCGDALDGFTVGMSVAALLGCVWCAGVAVGAKVAALFVC